MAAESRAAQKKGKTDHASAGLFKIGTTDFGIDLARSSCAIEDENGSTRIEIEIYGDETLFRDITEAADSEWSWTLYPPHFYLREFTVRRDRKTGGLRGELSIDDLEEIEAAVYLIEHNDIDATKVALLNGILRIEGIVSLSSDDYPFKIEWKV